MLEEIQPNPYQPRLEFNDEALMDLAQSIRENGLIQPITVRECEKLATALAVTTSYISRCSFAQISARSLINSTSSCNSLLALYLQKYGINLNDRQQKQFQRYADLLVEWNQKMNLTAITEENAVNEKCKQVLSAV